MRKVIKRTPFANLLLRNPEGSEELRYLGARDSNHDPLAIRIASESNRERFETYLKRDKPTLFCAHPFFLLSPVRPTLPQAISFLKIPSCWDLRSTLSSREKATSRGWVLGTVLDGVAPQGEKGKSFLFSLARKIQSARQLLHYMNLLFRD